MKCDKANITVLGLFLTVVIFVAGILVNNSMKASGEIQVIKDDTQRQIDQIRADTKDDLTEIKDSVKDLNKKFDEFILSQKT
jgi:hypothetical protein